MKNATPLHIAAKNNSEDMKILLMSKGANIDVIDNNFFNTIIFDKLKKFKINKGNQIILIKHHFIMQQKITQKSLE